MLDKFYNSIVFRIGSMMFAISFIAILSMFSSVFISELADKDALVINHAGSLRMQSYKILSELELLPQLKDDVVVAQQVRLRKSIDVFSDNINAPVMTANSKPLQLIKTENTLLDVQERWFSTFVPELNRLIDNPKLLTADKLTSLSQTIDNFVVRIDSLVALYQERAEHRILLIRMILGGSLLITTMFAAFTMFQISRRIEKPLSELTRSAKHLMAGDYSVQTKIDQNDELGLLAAIMNKMANAISESHRELENKVEAKTHKLRKSNGSLELLYQTSQLISQPGDILDLAPITHKLSEITEIRDIDLCITTAMGDVPYEHIMTSDKSLPENCSNNDCNNCLSNSTVNTTSSIDTMSMRYPIVKDETSYGVLICHISANKPIETWQHQLFTSISTLIANGLHAKQQLEQSRRIALLSERTVIARELHDSLAQALSYLKMQVACLQRLQKKEASQDKIDDVVNELKVGLNSAYRQLRELLTTFRLKIEANGMEQAFVDLVEQLNDRAAGNIAFSLDYRINNVPLLPNEEIHLLQIAREATQNVLNHSKGTLSNIIVYADEEKHVHLYVEDNGVGINTDKAKLNHYGMAIMEERSQHLHGDISIRNRATGGTCVELCFTPNYIKELDTVA